MFSRRTRWDLATNRYTVALEGHRRAGRELLDLTASNPTTIGLHYRETELLESLTHREALVYEPQSKGLLAAREAIASYYVERGAHIAPDDLVLTTSTSEGYSFAFRLLCDPGDSVLVPSPSYPLFDFLASIQDVRLVPYELIYDHGWQIDFHSLQSRMDRARAEGSPCRALLVVHPNNPTGSYVKREEAAYLNRICATNGMAIIADEVFLDYSLQESAPFTFAAAIEPKHEWETLILTLSGLSKISALPQMKVAWIALGGPEQLKVDALGRLDVIADTYLSMNAPVQWAIPAMLEERRNIQPQMMLRIRQNLAELDSQLARQDLCRRLEVEGGWYAVLRVPSTASDENFAINLLDKTGVLVHPGHFYDFSSSGCLILSLITPCPEFATGVGRLLQFVAAT